MLHSRYKTMMMMMMTMMMMMMMMMMIMMMMMMIILIIIIIIEIRIFFYNFLTAPRTVSNTHAQVARCRRIFRNQDNRNQFPKILGYFGTIPIYPHLAAGYLGTSRIFPNHL